MKTNHTPGPWRIPDWGQLGKIDVDAGDDVRIAAVYLQAETKRVRGWSVEEANARLIAAAPDLLRELAHLVRLLEPLERDGGLQVPGLATLNGAREVIRKASGGTAQE